MFARPSRSLRTTSLALGLGLLLGLTACSTEDSSSSGASAGEQVASTDSGATPAPATLTDAAPAADQVKPKVDPDAAKAAALRDEQRRRETKGADKPEPIDPAQYKSKMQELSQRLNKGEIDRKEYEQERFALEQAMRAGTQTAPKEIDPDGAKLVFATKEHDFGTVWDTEDLKFEFAFENQGKKTLEITRVKPSCGCTTTSLSRTSFEPGEGEMIPMVWKPKGVGPQKKTITVSHSNGPDQILNISANVKPFVQVEPKLLRLGDLAQHEEHHTELKLIPADPSFAITNIKASNQYLTATEKGRDEEGNILMDVVIKENAPWGNFNARLEIEGTGVTEPGAAPVSHTLMTQVIAKMYGDIRMEPEQIQLGIVAANAPFQGEALLYHVDGEEFELAELSMRFSRPEMTARWEKTTKDGNPAIKIIIEGDTTGFTERYVRGTAFFKTSLGDAENQQLQIAGSIR